MFNNLLCLMLYLGMICIIPACNGKQSGNSDNRDYIYVGTASGDAEVGIYRFQFDRKTGSLAYQGNTPGVVAPGFLTISPNNSFLYCVNRIAGQKEGGVSAYRIDPVNGELQFVNQQSSQGRGPCYISSDKSGKWLLVANYSQGNVAMLPVLEDGSIGAASDVAQHTGSSVNPQRQSKAFAHSINVDTKNRRAFAADLGADKIFIYDLDTQNGKLYPNDVPSVDIRPGCGPRHLDFHPNGKYLYVMNELIGSVTVFDYSEANGRLQEIETVSTVPDTFAGNNKSADIHVHPSGKFVYASNRGFDSIAVFEIDQMTGRLTFVDRQHEQIKWPRNFAIDPTGEFLLVANRDTDNIVVFRIDQDTGKLVHTGNVVDTPKPICIKFCRLTG